MEGRCWWGEAHGGTQTFGPGNGAGPSSAACLGVSRPAAGFAFCPAHPPPLQPPGGSQAGLWRMGEGFMAGGDTAGASSLGHSQHHLLRHLPD